MKDNTLNNVDAYRFIMFYVVPTAEAAFQAEGIKTIFNKPTGKDIADIVLKVRLDGSLKQTSPTLYYNGADSVAISLHKMMYSKNILIIKDGKIYILDTMKLQAVWSNPSIVRVDKRAYTDGIGFKAQMSRIDIDWFTDNADYIFDIPEEIYNMYIENFNHYMA